MDAGTTDHSDPVGSVTFRLVNILLTVGIAFYDWTNFEGYPFHHPQPEIDLRREILLSVKATAAFLAVLSIAAIFLAIQINRGPGDATTEGLPSAASSVPLFSAAGITDNAPTRQFDRTKP